MKRRGERIVERQRKADSFGTFLRNVQSGEAVSDPQVRLLQVLSASGPTPIPKLAAASGVELSVFLKTLQALRELRLVAVGDDDVVALTQSGEEIAKGAAR